MSQPRETLAKNLKALRKVKGWNQDDLAEAAGLGVQAIRKLETMRTWVSSDSIEALASALKVEPGDLLRSNSVIPIRQDTTAPSKHTLLGALVAEITTLNEDALRFLEPFVKAAKEITSKER